MKAKALGERDYEPKRPGLFCLAVNHGGDSDSTGAMTGNILGALWGKTAIPDEFLTDLELRDVIEEMAKDIVAFDASAYWDKYPGY